MFLSFQCHYCPFSCAKTSGFLVVNLRSIEMLDDKIMSFQFAVFCLAWWRLVVLIGRDYVKKRSVDKQPVYELLPAGEVLAKELKSQFKSIFFCILQG